MQVKTYKKVRGSHSIVCFTLFVATICLLMLCLQPVLSKNKDKVESNVGKRSKVEAEDFKEDPKVEAEDSQEDPKVEAEDSLEDPKVEAEDSLEDPKVEAEDSLEDPKVEAEDFLEDPKVEAEDSLEDPKVEAEQSGISSKNNAKNFNKEFGNELEDARYDRRAVEYARIKNILYFVNIAYGFVVLVLLIIFQIASRIRNFAQEISSYRFVQVVIFVPLLMLVLAVLQLPFSIYSHRILLEYGQSIQGWGSWFWDWGKIQFIAFIFNSLLVWIMYEVIRRSIRKWWFYFWLVSLPIIIFIFFITPLFQPLFFKSELLETNHPELVSEIQKVIKRGGLNISSDRFYVMKASEKLKAINAHITGIGPTKGVYIWDTAIDQMTTPEILSIVGHEMGHYGLNHLFYGIAFFSILLLIFLYIGYRVLNWLLARWSKGWAIRSVDDLASLPVIMLMFAVLNFVVTPIASGFSRYNEHQADIYGIEVTHGLIANAQQAAANAHRIIGKANLSDPSPNPLIKLWIYTHPPTKERILFAESYDPWSSGGSPKYVK